MRPCVRAAAGGWCWVGCARPVLARTWGEETEQDGCWAALRTGPKSEKIEKEEKKTCSILRINKSYEFKPKLTLNH